MSGGACQKAAQQANDVLAQQAKRDEDCGCGGGCAPAPALGKRDAHRPKKGANRRGPGCQNADCNACAEQADEVMNAVAGFSDGIPEFSFADVQRARLLAGFRPSVSMFGGSQVAGPASGGAGWRVGSDLSRRVSTGDPVVDAREEFEAREGRNCSYYTDCDKCAEAPAKCAELCPEVYRECYPPTSTGPHVVVPGELSMAGDLLIPPHAQWGSDCELSEADCPVPSARRRLGTDIQRSLVSVPQSYIGCSESFTDVLNAAWILLNENTDLIEWVVCSVFGKSGGCISAIASWSSFLPPNVECSSREFGFWPPCPEFVALTIWPHITFCSTKAVNEVYANAFQCGTDADRLCVAIDMAATLFHEFTHFCGLNTGDLAGKACQTSYLAENSFKWALLNRYPAALDSGCCGDNYGNPLDPDLFMQDNATTMIQRGSCFSRFEEGC